MNKWTRNDWLMLVDDSQQTALIRLMETAPFGRAQQALRMLLAPGIRPADEAEAKARAIAVMTYLTGEGVVNAAQR